MMVSRDGAFGILIGAAIGTLFLVPAHGSAQDSLSVSCADVGIQSPLEDLTRCAEQGDGEAQYNLGMVYGVGRGIPEDDAEAVRWYRLAAEQGVAEAQYLIGIMYADGDGVPEDDAEAQYSLAFFYSFGLGVLEDDSEAVRWYRLAAEQGNAGAQIQLGGHYAAGYGVPEDDAEAVRWYRLAAEQGHVDAQFLLGVSYSSGVGVPEDAVLAYMWYNLSAAQGSEIAQSNKEIIEQRMTREQIAEAQRLSREWIEAHPPDGGN